MTLDYHAGRASDKATCAGQARTPAEAFTDLYEALGALRESVQEGERRFDQAAAIAHMMDATAAQHKLHTARPDRAAKPDTTAALKEMMRDPRYWRDRDPKHIKKVTDCFAALAAEREQA